MRRWSLCGRGTAAVGGSEVELRVRRVVGVTGALLVSGALVPSLTVGACWEGYRFSVSRRIRSFWAGYFFRRVFLSAGSKSLKSKAGATVVPISANRPGSFKDSDKSRL